MKLVNAVELDRNPGGAYPNSCYVAQDRSTCAVFVKEDRMKFASATNLDKCSGLFPRR